MTYFDSIQLGLNLLKYKKINNPRLDLELLLAEACMTRREEILLNLGRVISDIDLKNFLTLVKKRSNKMPIAQIIGKKEFWKHSFFINKEVLIPRPETETLVECALKMIKKDNSLNVLDIGTGSGCIIISILKERKKCKGVALDKSKAALIVAKTNAKIQHIANRIRFINSDIDNFSHNKYDFIISNPPYLKKSSINNLEEDVKKFEPHIALDGGIDGYEVFRKVIKKSSEQIKKNGKLILEIDCKQNQYIKDMLKIYKFYTVKTLKDLSGLDRCIVAIKN